MVTNINNRGEMVGPTPPGAGCAGSCRTTQGQFTPIDPPGAAATLVTDINDRGDFVGDSSEVGADELFSGVTTRASSSTGRRLPKIEFPGAAAPSSTRSTTAARSPAPTSTPRETAHGLFRDPQGATSESTIPTIWASGPCCTASTIAARPPAPISEPSYSPTQPGNGSRHQSLRPENSSTTRRRSDDRRPDVATFSPRTYTEDTMSTRPRLPLRGLVSAIAGAALAVSDTPTMRGFLRDRDGNFTTITPPGAAIAKVGGINNRSAVVGIGYPSATENAGGFGFVRARKGRYTTFRVPDTGPESRTVASDINDRGEIAGWSDDGRRYIGYVHDGAIVRIEHPGGRGHRARRTRRGDRRHRPERYQRPRRRRGQLRGRRHDLRVRPQPARDVHHNPTTRSSGNPADGDQRPRRHRRYLQHIRPRGPSRRCRQASCSATVSTATSLSRTRGNRCQRHRQPRTRRRHLQDTNGIFHGFVSTATAASKPSTTLDAAGSAAVFFLNDRGELTGAYLSTAAAGVGAHDTRPERAASSAAHPALRRSGRWGCSPLVQVGESLGVSSAAHTTAPASETGGGDDGERH